MRERPRVGGTTLKKLVITRGLPGSGKSARARAWVNEDPNHRAEVNRDSIRAMLHGGYIGDQDVEAMVTTVSHQSIRELLRSGVSVVCSDTNLPQRHAREIARIGQSQGADVEVWDMTNVDIDLCHVRNNQRTDKRPVPMNVIEDMYARYIKGHPYPLPSPVENSGVKFPDLYVPILGTPEADICDIDGTVADSTGIRSPHDYSLVSKDRAKRKVIELVQDRAWRGRKILFVSGRPERAREDTEAWLRSKVRIPYTALWMRPNGDHRNDAIVKREIFDTYIRFRYDIGVVFDDRDRVVRMWREELGLTVAQVAYGSF